MADDNQMDCSGSAVTNLRNARYCEVLPVTVDKGTHTQTMWVYNTICLNDCPSDEWNALTSEEVVKEYKQENPDTVAAKLNGPRYWVMDRLEGSGVTTTGQEFTFGGIEMALRAQLHSTVKEAIVEDRPWVPHQVDRETRYTYKAGELVYELSSPDGAIYIMQSYSQQKDPTLTIDQLPFLGPKLTFPTPDWSYKSYPLEQDYVLITTGVAFVIQDNFLNTYQQRPETI